MAGPPITPFELDTVTAVSKTDHMMLFGASVENDIEVEDLLQGFRAIADADKTGIRLAVYDVNGKIAAGDLPAGYDDTPPAGTWAIDNTSPVLSDGSGTVGTKYKIVAAGTIDEGAGTLSIDGDAVAIGDTIVKGTTNWYIVPAAVNLLDGKGTEQAGRDALGVYSKSEIDNNVLSKAAANAVKFAGNGTDRLVTANTSLLSAGDGTKDFPLSGAAILRANDYTSCAIFGRETGSSLQEWVFEFNGSDKLTFTLFDESAASQIAVTQDVASVVDGQWVHAAFTYDGRGGSSAGDGVTLYINGNPVAATAVESGTYVASEALTQPLEIGLNSKSGADMDGQIQSVVIGNRELSADEVSELKKTGNRFGVSDQWANDTEVLSNSDMASWESASNANNWNEGSSTTVAQDGTNKYSGSYAMHYTSSGNAIASGVNHQIRQGDLVQPGWNKVEIVLKNAAAGSFEFGVNNTKLISFDGTTVSEFESGYQTAYPGSALGSVTKKDLGSGWFRLTVYHKLSNALPRDFVIGGTGQWYIDSASNKKSGFIAAYLPENIQSDGGWIDASSNKLNASSSGVTPLSIPTPQSAHSPSDASTDIVEQITAGASKTVIHKRMGNGVIKDCPIASQREAGQGYQEVIVTGSVANDAEWVLDDNMLGTQPRGFVEITQSGGSALHICLAALQGQAGAPVLVSDPFSNWSITKDTASKVNLYRDTANSNKTTIQNKTGGSLNFTIYLKSYYLA